ncbi:intercellular adhesion molecule 2 isoform X1 [Rousettus aegyptiacus]|uniref:Intercellular adhesion molecule 2 n=1 Tax=Rousettus aegyptiacus TaxID=9407 RepID=A0A7J8G9B9_ROUAE|nr:intercellular adhesion molecule 2 isoform X1 [Rousettus aegyptiacus]XP_015984233.2 intercellular adhesion molecule 2 isoform X1 [Rousettus aegyptiacus]KAF6456458.1 intercellular adhesion molecule 2 [Rousettus aegyptiacus]
MPPRTRTPVEMSPFGSWGLPAALLALLCCPGSSEKAPSKQEAVKLGDSYKINCTSDCPNPLIKGLETLLDKKVLQEQAQWTEYLVSNISQDSVLYCYSTCSGKQTKKAVIVNVFHPPEQVLLRLQPARVTVGSSFTITCSVTAAIPLERLTLTLLHGEKPLHVQTFENGTDTPATATHNAIAHKKDGHHNFSCRADLDLHALGRGVISNVSEVQVLQVYAVAPETDRDLQGARSLEDPKTNLPDPTYMSGTSTTTAAASGAPQGSSPALAEGLWQAAGLLGIFLFVM